MRYLWPSLRRSIGHRCSACVGCLGWSVVKGRGNQNRPDWGIIKSEHARTHLGIVLTIGRRVRVHQAGVVHAMVDAKDVAHLLFVVVVVVGEYRTGVHKRGRHVRGPWSCRSSASTSAFPPRCNSHYHQRGGGGDNGTLERVIVFGARGAAARPHLFFLLFVAPPCGLPWWYRLGRVRGGKARPRAHTPQEEAESHLITPTRSPVPRPSTISPSSRGCS